MPRNRTWSCCFSIRRNVSRNAENRSRSRFAAETAPRFRLCARGELRLTELATGKTVAKVPWSLTIPANGTADAVLSVTVGKYGVYKLSGKELPSGFQFGCAAPQRPASKESRHRFELGTSALFPTNNEIPGDFVFDSRNAGAMEYCDAVSFHPYSAQLDCSLRNAHELNRVIRSLSKRKDGRALPVWNTELYYIRPGAPVDSGVDPVEAKYVFRRFLIDLGDGIAKSVSLHASVIFSRSDLNHGQFTALFRREPIPNDIFIAHAAAGAMLNDAVPLKKHLYSKYVNSTAFRHADGWYGLGIWSVEPESKMLLTLPEAKAPVQVYDCFGNEIAAPEKLTDAPVVFRFNGDEAAFDEWRGGIRVAPFCPWKYHGARVMNKQLLMAFENISSEPLLLKVRPVLPGFSATSVTIPAASAKEVSVIASRNLPESFECVVFDGKKMTKVKVTPRKPKTAAFGEPLSIDGKASCTVTPEKEFLRIALNVKDSVRGKRNPKAIWLGDTVELFFDAEPWLVPDRRFYTPFCKRLFLARKSANGLEEKLEGMRMDASAVRWNIRERNDGYQAVLEIPWASLGTVPGAPLGFDACVNDYDDSGKLISRAFWAGNQDNHKDRTLFGILK